MLPAACDILSSAWSMTVLSYLTILEPNLRVAPHLSHHSRHLLLPIAVYAQTSSNVIRRAFSLLRFILFISNFLSWVMMIDNVAIRLTMVNYKTLKNLKSFEFIDTNLITAWLVYSFFDFKIPVFGSDRVGPVGFNRSILTFGWELSSYPLAMN